MLFNTKSFLLHLLSASTALSAALPAPAPTQTTALSPRHASLANRAEKPTSVPTGIFTTTKYVTVGGVTNAHVTIPGNTITIAIPTCIQTETPDKNGYVPPGTCGAIYDYYPSLAAAITFTILFAGSMIAHIYQAAAARKRWCWVIIMACIWEMMAFVFRSASVTHQQSTGVYLVFQIFILLAPIWVNAFAYMTLGRMVYYFLPSRSIFGMPAATLAAVFVGLDIISFIIQIVGGSMSGPGAPPEQQQAAIHTYMGGIGLQEFFILIFVAICIQFQRQMHKREGPRFTIGDFFASSWGKLLSVLYFSLLMISIRIIYRLVEFSGGLELDNPLITHEAFFYVLEAIPMLLALLAFNLVHPGKIMTGPDSDMPGLFSMVKSKFSRRKHKVLLDNQSDSEVELRSGWDLPQKFDATKY
ncbi:RTA1-involved in 7-aminocholesterol resistance [Fusarium albosuccineum]|uniref:RTA1-involved in 7-aminocholesterol resistance n=1 Tax=Fusarium albosuccineum TaxID=1237068 RepID=A0A8H4L6J7_9HYPO|nr:RTA1-involved in 7-aminocholesterol resistance [Fusarium albosuccineum]